MQGRAPGVTQMTKEARRKGRLSQCGNERSQQNREELMVICTKDARDLEPGCTAGQVIIETTHFLLRKLGEKKNQSPVASHQGVCHHIGRNLPGQATAVTWSQNSRLILEQTQLLEGIKMLGIPHCLPELYVTNLSTLHILKYKPRFILVGFNSSSITVS